MKVLVIRSESMGNGSEELGRQLMASFLRKVWASQAKPDVIVFYNAGVQLLAVQSPVVDALVGLADSGVDLVACGTCVGYYNLKNSLMAGRISDMQEISSLLLTSDSVITI